VPPSKTARAEGDTPATAVPEKEIKSRPAVGDTLTPKPAATPIARATGGRWAPGQSGNPAGRAQTGKAFRERCRKWANEKGFAILAEMAESAGRDRSRATELLMAYAFGKPTQAVEYSGQVTRTDALDGFTVDEMRAWLEMRRKRNTPPEPQPEPESVAATPE